MKYVIQDNLGFDVSLEINDSDEVTLYANGDDFYFTPGQFKEFRRAVGYVWTEIEGKA